MKCDAPGDLIPRYLFFTMLRHFHALFAFSNEAMMIFSIQRSDMKGMIMIICRRSLFILIAGASRAIFTKIAGVASLHHHLYYRCLCMPIPPPAATGALSSVIDFLSVK